MMRHGFMRSRFSVVRGVVVSTLGVALLGCEATQNAGGDAGVVTAEMQAEMAPADVLADLKAGNERFVEGRLTRRAWLRQVEATADGQHPKAMIIGCVDSRVPPEVVFDQGIGDIFVGRVAGNFENVDLLGSAEFATAAAGSKLIVVLGHTSCGAVKGTVDQVRLGNLTEMLAEIEPAVSMVPHEPEDRTSENIDFVNRVAEANVRRTVRDMTARSEVISERVAAGNLKVVGAMYDISTGRVTWLDS